MTPDLNKLAFSGNEDIELDILEDTNEIKINANGIKITSAKIAKNNLVSTGIKYDKEKHIAAISFNESIKKGRAVLSLSFNGKIREDLSGFYKSVYTKNGKKEIMAASHFEAIHARECFPCFDEPALKAKFLVTFNIDKNLDVFSNMPIKKETINNSVKTVQFEETPIMSTYLLAFIVGKLEFIEKKARDGTLVRVITTPGKKEQGKFALDFSIKVLEYYNNYFGIKYPLPKLDMVALPDFEFGAMENWGLITYRENSLLFDEKNSSAANKQRIAIVVAHEIAHQWFGNLVTMEWWNDLWLNEGFASWIEYKAVDSIFPEWNLWTQFLNQDQARALALDGLESSHPIEVDVANPEDLGEIFDAVSYSKGACIIKMLENYLGEDVFRKGMQHYINSFLYGNARTEDLWKSLEFASKKPIKKIMDSWTKQTGYPIISASLTKDGILLTQEKFLYTRKKENALWHIPVSVSESSKLAYHEMSCKELKLKPGILNVNTAQNGFYRVNYDKALFSKLLDELKNNRLSSLERFGIQNDAYAICLANYISLIDYLNVIKLYKTEKDYTVWLDLASNINQIKLILSNEKYNSKLDQFTLNLFSQILEYVGWDEKKNEKHTDSLLRSWAILTSGLAGNQKVFDEANRRFSLFLKDGKLNPNIRGPVYMLTACSGDKKTFNALKELYKNSESHQEKVRLLAGLCSFKQENIIKEALKFGLSEEVRSQDFVYIMNYVSTNAYSKNFAWRFLADNWKKINEKYSGGYSISGFIETAAARLSSLDDYEEVNSFFKKNPAPSAKMAIQHALETIKINNNFLKNNKNILTQNI